VTVLLTVTPGVDTFVVIRNVLRGGKKDGIITSFGICFGLFFHATLSACGLSIILVQSAFMFHSVKILGAIYLCYLGLSSLLNALNRKESFEVNPNISNAGNGVATNSFREGFLSNVLNPKPAIFYVAFLPQFINASDPVFLKSMFLASVQFIIGIFWLVLLSISVYIAGNYLKNSFVRRILDTISGSVLVALGIKLGMESE
jgi:threonine/homoserine/homoserine lactone efflux protein